VKVRSAHRSAHVFRYVISKNRECNCIWQIDVYADVGAGLRTIVHEFDLCIYV
jgi:hypothetical protein